MKKQYCAIKDGQQAVCFDTKGDAISYAKKEKYDSVILIKYDLKDKDYKSLEELGCEKVWDKGESKK